MTKYRKNTTPPPLIDHKEHTPWHDHDGDLFDSAKHAIGGTSSDWSQPKGRAVSSTGWSSGPRCHASHKELTLGNGVILGASCNDPRPGYDVYVGFDWGMKVPHGGPWQETTPQHYKFEIQDMHAPKATQVQEFKDFINWLESLLNAGKRVHIGCIGGHGRTGLVLSALVKQMTGNADAITWLREHYCKKAVESTAQVNFLHEHYGINKVAGAKAGTWGAGDLKYDKQLPKGSHAAPKGAGVKPGGGSMGMTGGPAVGKAVKAPQTKSSQSALTAGDRITPLRGPGTILGPAV